MERLIFLYLALFPFGQLTRLPVQLIQLPEVNIYLTDLIVGVGGSLWLIRKLLSKRLDLPPISKEISSFVIIASFSLILASPLFSGREVLVGSLYLLRWAAYALWFFIAWELVRKNKEFAKTLFNSLILVGVAVAVFGLIQYLVMPDMRPFTEFGWDEHYFRLVGTFLDPGFTSIILVFFLLLLVGKFLTEISKNRFLLVGALILGFLALALTYSRSGYLALLAGMAAISWIKRKPQLFLGTFLLLLVTATLLPRPGGLGVQLERTETIEARIRNWKQSLIISSDFPLFGVGFNTYRYIQEKYDSVVERTAAPSHSAAGSDSSLLFVLATTGVVGLLVYLSLWFRIIKLGGIVILASTAALAVHSLFQNSLFYPWVLGWLAIILSFLPAQK